jgi:uncharacterized protein (TIGR00369 family)
MAEIPPGFIQVLRAPFINHVGPLLQREVNPPGTMVLGVQVAEIHANSLGLMHGGMIGTICDSSMARAAFTQLQRRTVTLRMNLEYLDPVRKGVWLEARGRLIDHDEEVARTECRVMVGETLCARATGVFRLLRRV